MAVPAAAAAAAAAVLAKGVLSSNTQQ